MEEEEEEHHKGVRYADYFFLLAVLFIFLILLCLLCIGGLMLTRWSYKRRTKDKLDEEREKHRRDEDAWKECERKLREEAEQKNERAQKREDDARKVYERKLQELAKREEAERVQKHEREKVDLEQKYRRNKSEIVQKHRVKNDVEEYGKQFREEVERKNERVKNLGCQNLEFRCFNGKQCIHISRDGVVDCIDRSDEFSGVRSFQVSANNRERHPQKSTVMALESSLEKVKTPTTPTSTIVSIPATPPTRSPRPTSTTRSPTCTTVSIPATSTTRSITSSTPKSQSPVTQITEVSSIPCLSSNSLTKMTETDVEFETSPPPTSTTGSTTPTSTTRSIPSSTPKSQTSGTPKTDVSNIPSLSSDFEARKTKISLNKKKKRTKKSQSPKELYTISHSTTVTKTETVSTPSTNGGTFTSSTQTSENVTGTTVIDDKQESSKIFPKTWKRRKLPMITPATSETSLYSLATPSPSSPPLTSDQKEFFARNP